MTPKTAIVYCRTSTQGQKEAETITAQVTRCRELVERHGLTLAKYGPKRDGWVIDDGVSGSLLEGRQFAALVDDIRRKRVKVDVLVVYSLSRIARLDKSSRDPEHIIRSHEDTAKIKGVLVAHNVKVIDCDGEIDPASITLEIKMMLAAEEYKLIRERTMSGKARRHAEGHYAHGGRAPYGYTVVGDKKSGRTVVAHPQNAGHLRRVLEMYAEHGAAEAARRANAETIPTQYGTGTWQHSTVWWLVQRAERYMTGTWEIMLDGVPTPMKWPSLIDHKLYSAVEQRRHEHKPAACRQMLSTGLVDCATCGGHVNVMNGGGATAAQYSYVGCRRCGRLHEAEFSRALWAATVVRMTMIAEARGPRRGDPHALDVRVRAEKQKIEAADAKLAKLLDLYMADGLDKATYMARSRPFQEARAAALAEIARLESERTPKTQPGDVTPAQEAKRVLHRLARAGAEPTTDVKRDILRQLLDGGRVTVAWAPHAKGKALVPWAEVTFPARPRIGLDAWTIRTTEIGDVIDVLRQWHGVDAVDDVAIGA